MPRPAASTDPQARSAAPQPAIETALYEVRRKIYPRAVSGRYAHWRLAFVIGTQGLFYGLPWVQWNGRQAVLFDLGARKFYLFGLVLWPQDVIYLAVLLLISAFGLFLFTAIAGRLFCGYACPQTVYTEIFMWIERRIEGNRIARIRLDGDPWSVRKLRLKLAKHAAWFLVAGWTGFTFVGYFSPIAQLARDVAALSAGPWPTFWIVFYAFATWGNAGFMREQVCKYMCPYARFQSVMVDPDTLVVTYDEKRGEPRGGRSRHQDARSHGLGDCVNCSICVQVCPTGIDIRDGLQYECIGCAACIDACDQVMEKMQYAPGLIRYTSEHAMRAGLSAATARRRMLRPRVMAYTTIWLLLIVGLLAAILLRSPLRVDVMRDRGVLARETEGAWIENVYQLQIINTREQAIKVTVRARGLPGLVVKNGHVIDVAPIGNRLVPVVLRLPLADAAAAGSGPHPIRFVVQESHVQQARHGHRVQETSTFVVPQ